MSDMGTELSNEAKELIEEINRIFAEMGGEGDYTEALAEVAADEYTDGEPSEDLRTALEVVLTEQGVDEETRRQVLDALDETESPEEFTVVINQTYVDNSLDIGDGAEIHGGITQANDTNTSNATGDGAIAGRDQEGQFQTGENNTQVGHGNEGVVGVEENSGVIAGNDASTGAVNSGENILTNEDGHVAGAFAFGEGAEATDADTHTEDYSINDSENVENAYNVDGSENATDSYNETYTDESSLTVDAHIKVDADSDYDGYDTGYEDPKVPEYGHDDHDYHPSE